MSLKILQSTVERLLYILLLFVFLAVGAVYWKLSTDDARKFHILKANQDQIFCVIKAPPTLATAPRIEQIKFINSCISNNR